MTLLSNRAQQIEPFHVMTLVARAQAMRAQGQPVIQLAVGEWDEPTPSVISDAGQRAIAQQDMRYSPAIGNPELRQALANYYAAELNQTVRSSQIAITSGASAALQLAFLAVADAGDSVMHVEPGYPCNHQIASLLGLSNITTQAATPAEFAPSLDRIKAAWQPNTRALVLASPANPTGQGLRIDQLTALADWLAEQGAWLIVDEIYHGLMFDRANAISTALQLPPVLRDQLIVVNSFSKTFAMTGWRLGWMVMPAAIVPAVDKMAQNLFLAPSTLAQAAALGAFNQSSDGPNATESPVQYSLKPSIKRTIDNRVQTMQSRVAFVIEKLKALGFGVTHQPEGAFYVFVDAQPITQRKNSASWCELLLGKTGVAVAPGIDFGTSYASWIRIAVTADISVLGQAFERIADFINADQAL